MSEQPFACVVDANVALKLFFEQPDSDRADGLFALLETSAPARFYVPGIFYAECVNAFAKYVRLARITGEEARNQLADLLALDLSPVPTAGLTQDALEISLQYEIGGYDALYVALSARVSAPFVTADEKLVRALAGKAFDVQSLSTFSTP